MRRRLMADGGQSSLYIALAGHRGGGKTTELYRLREEIGSKFHCLYLEANQELNAHRFEIEDLLLVLCRAVVQDMERIKLPLSAEDLQAVLDWFSQVTRTTEVGKTYLTELESQAKIGIDSTFAGALFTRFQALLKSSSSEREEVRNTLRKYPGALLEATNRLLRNGSSLLRQQRRQGLLIIIDNMDRYSADFMEEFLRASGDTLTSLACSLVITPPLSLAYLPKGGGPLESFVTQVLPAFPTRDRGMPYDALLPEAERVLEALLAHRLDVAAVIPDIAARRRLYVASGGVVRELIELVGEASLEVDEAPIALPDVERVVKRRKARVRSQLQVQGYFPLLRVVAGAKALTDDARCVDLLFARFVLEYNGEGWFDVHPLVAELLAEPPAGG